jgi:ubiquinone/menaquinone biosynthesis C-methylase UbiE
MNKLKELWEKLAQKNSKYYIFTDKGKNITEEDFRQSGENDYMRLIVKDFLFVVDEPLLEIGCGNGRMTEWITQDFTVIGIDISEEMIRQVKLRVRKNAKFLVSDGKTIPLGDNSVGSAFSYLVFQHMKTRKMIEENFKEVYRVLKKGGMFKVLLRYDEVNLKQWWGGVNYDEKSAIILAESFGFYVEKIEKVNNYGLWLWLKK